MNTTSLGRQAEQVVAQSLKNEGFKILERNWRTRLCEIDIVAQKHRIVYFVEVKYRISTRQGDPVEYITRVKLRQMSFAAELWASQNHWDGDIQLAVAAVSGDKFKLDDLIFLD